MHGLVYEYQVDPARVARFEELYGPDGPRTRFRGAAGYLGTELPLVAVALGAEVTAQGPDGARDLAATW